MKKAFFCILLTVSAIAVMYIGGRLYVVSSTYAAETVLPEKKGLMDYVTVSGKVTEKGRTDVYAGMPVRVVECFVSAGDEVAAGDVLMIVKRSDESVSASVVYDEIKKAVEGILKGAESNRSSIVAAADIVELKGGVLSLCSPCAGTVMNIVEENNAFIPHGKACAAISDLNNLEISAYLGEAYISAVSVGDDCIIKIPALCDEELSGKLEKIMPYAATSFSLSGSSKIETELKISLPERSDILKPGYSAVVKIVTDLRENAVIVPFEAIGQDTDDREYVLCLNNKKAEKIYIITGKELADKCEVVSGLMGNERLILNPEKVPERCISVR